VRAVTPILSGHAHRDGCPFRKSYPDAVVVQPGKDWDGDDGASPLHGPTQWRILVERQVRANLVVIREFAADVSAWTGCWSLARPGYASTRNANKRSKVRAGTKNRSMAAIACTWFRKNVSQLLRRRPTLHDVFGDGRLGDLKAEHQKLAMDSGCSPLWIFLAHPSDQVTQAAIDLWPSCPGSRLPPPERLEARAVPPKNWSPAERLASHRAGSAKDGSSRPAARGHCRVAEDAAAHASRRS